MTMSVKVQNGSSTSVNSSWKGRENRTTKKSSNLLIFTFLLAFLSFSSDLKAQESTYEVFNLIFKYPASCSIFDTYVDNNEDGSSTCSFILSMVNSEGQEERMKVIVEKLEEMIQDAKVIEDMGLPSLIVGSLDCSPRYSRVKEEMSGSGKGFYYSDYTARYYYYIRESPESKMYYRNIRGRVVVKLIGYYYLVSFVMEGPETSNFSTMQKIVNSVSMKPIYG